MTRATAKIRARDRVLVVATARRDPVRLDAPCPARIDLVDRATGSVHAVSGDAVALDPHRVRIARAAGDRIELLDIAE
jgi:hypothetical protein